MSHLLARVRGRLTAVLLACGRTDERRDATRPLRPAAAARPARGRRSCWSRSTRRARTRSVRSARRRDAGVQRDRRARHAVPPGLRDGAGDAAVAQLDDDRPLSRPATASTRTRGSLPPRRPFVAERLQQAGYRTAAFVSSFALARRFGLARGFDVYDDELPAGHSERTAPRDDRRRSLAELASRLATGRASSGCTTTIRTRPTRRRSRIDPHTRPLRTSAKWRPWTSSSAASSRRSSRARPGPAAVIVVARSRRRARRSRRGAARQSALPVDDARAAGAGGTGRHAGRERHAGEHAARLPHDPRLGRARRGAQPARARTAEVVLGEGMKPFLEYGWQPQVMAVEGAARRSSRASSRPTICDRDPRRGAATSDRAPTCRRRCGTRLEDYPVPSPEAARAPDDLDDEARRRLASLGYVSAGAAPVVRKDAPRPADMTALLRRSRTRVGALRQRRVRGGDPAAREDPRRGSEQPRRGAAPRDRALVARPRAPARRPSRRRPRSRRGRRTCRPTWRCTTRAARTGRAPCRCSSRSSPRRRIVLPALEALAVVRERQGRAGRGGRLRQQIYRLRTPSAGELVQLGQLAMSAQQTQPRSTRSRRPARRRPAAFTHDLELGVLLSRGAAAAGRRGGARSRPGVLARVSDGAVQARAGQRAARRAGSDGADRRRRGDRPTRRRGR